MDLSETMILIDGIDKTEEIEYVHEDLQHNTMEVKYKSTSKVYPYGRNRVRKFNNPRKIELADSVAYEKDIPIYAPKAIQDFGEKVRIIDYRDQIRIVDAKDFRVVPSSSGPNANMVLDYLKEIAGYTSSQPGEEAFLEREMERLTFIHPESVLGAYLNGEPVRRRQLEEDNVIFPFRFNLSQKKALEHGLTSSISVIEGPPGTGKTQTILNIIANLAVVQKKSVAVVSNNNEAVKNVAEKMEQKGYGFLTAMLGKSENQDRFFASMPEARTEGWNCSETKAQLMEQLHALNIRLNHLLDQERRRARLRQELADWKLEARHFEAYCDGQNRKDMEDFPLMKASPQKIMDFLVETSQAREQERTDKLLFRLRMIFKYGILKQRQMWEKEDSVLLNLEREFYKKQIGELEQDMASCDRELEGACFDDLIREHQKLSEQFFRKCLWESHGREKEVNFTRKNYKRIFSDFIRRFPIILSTTYALRMSIPQNYLLDYVIIDEASQVDLITGVLALSCCRNVIVVGDLKQLSQITDRKIKDQLRAESPGPVYDYFSQSILSSLVALYGNGLPREILREHYRCHPRIIGFCNQRYYGGELIPYTEENPEDCPLILYKTTEGNHMRHVTEGEKRGFYNQRELDVIVREILDNPDLARIPEHIGIVTPYRRQADKAAQLTRQGIESDTVHKYQGREKDIIIMSTVLSGERRKEELEFVDDAQMINVAVSRAIRQFILVTDHDLFYKKGKDMGDLIRYIQYSTLDENIIQSQVVSVFDLLYQQYSSSLHRYRARMKPSPHYKSEEILRVLLEEILQDRKFERFDYRQGVLLSNLLNKTELLDEGELRFVNRRASLDFVVYRKSGKEWCLVIEVDGFAFHENNPRQLENDRMKDRILAKYHIPILRLPTNGSGEDEKIRNALRQLM